MLHRSLQVFFFGVVLAFVGPLSFGCTIFVLTDARSALFCNNEDWKNPKTRMWFVPGHGKSYSAVYVGFDNGFPQGGMNTEGLAFDWVAGCKEVWMPDPNLPRVWSTHQLLETCATVDEAITFYRTHAEGGFTSAKILVADRSGASAIIGAHDGKLTVDRSTVTRGFGFGGETLDRLLAASPAPTFTQGAKILQACRQLGDYPTRYSNIFDLKTGDISVSLPDKPDAAVKLNLGEELKKGPHIFDIPELAGQMEKPLQPLPAAMSRIRLADRYKPLKDADPTLVAKVRRLIEELESGKSVQADFTDEVWRDIKQGEAESRAIGKLFGRLKRVTLVECSKEGANLAYRFVAVFQNNTVLFRLVFTPDGKVALFDGEEVQ